ncbi:reverse transcriptase domain-containing protein [Tanacetum coccineum]
MDAAIRNQGASIKTLEIQIGQMSKVLQERGFRSLPSSTEANSRDRTEPYTDIRDKTNDDSISKSFEWLLCDEKKGSYGPQFSKAYSEASHIDNSIPRKEKDPGSFTLPCFINNVCFDNALVNLGSSVSVMPLSTYLNLRLGELAHTKLTVELADKTVKYPKGIAENVLVSIEPFKLRRNQGDDLMPTIEEGEVIEEFRTRDDELDFRIDDYPSYCDYDKKIHIDCAHNLKFSCMIGFEFTHANFFPLLYVNVMSKKFHNSIMKDKMVYKGNNVIGALMNVPIFVGTFSVVTDFAVLEDTDAYRDEGMGDVIFGEPFLSEFGIKARRFEGMITIYNGNESETTQNGKIKSRFKTPTTMSNATRSHNY